MRASLKPTDWRLNFLARVDGRVIGTQILARRGEPATNVRLALTNDGFKRPTWQVEVSGLEACLPLLRP